MTYEAQIALRSNDPDQLADDVRAISEFIEQRRRRPRAPRADETSAGARNDRPRHGHLELVGG